MSVIDLFPDERRFSRNALNGAVRVWGRVEAGSPVKGRTPLQGSKIGPWAITPQFFGALRWNQQLFATVPVGQGQSEKWGNDIWRIDAAITYRWTERIQTKLQYSFTDQNLPGANQEHLVAAQLTVRF